MNGFVKNKTFMWTHAMKRSVRPGEKIPLDDLYTQYGKKHNLAEGEEFVNWLRNIKLKNEDMWEIVFQGEGSITVDELKEEKPRPNEPLTEEIKDPNEERDERVLTKELTVRDIVDLSVRRARIILPKVMDLNLLRYALQEVNQLAGKETLLRMLRKRVEELRIAR